MWLVIVLIILTVFFSKGYLNLWIKSSKIPGPPSLPFIGTTQLLKNNKDFLLNLVEIIKKYPTPMKVWLGTKLNVLVDRPEDVQTVLTQCLNRQDFLKFLECFGGSGLITLDTPDWQIHRKLLNPCFSSVNIQAFIQIFDMKSKILVENLESEIGTGDFNINYYLNNCVLELICETSTGVEMNFQKNENFEYINAAENLQCCVAKRILSPWLHPDFLFKFSSLYRRQIKFAKITKDFAIDVFRCKKDKLNCVKEGKSSIYADQLMNLYKNGLFTESDVIGEIATIIIAGSETSSLAVSYTILMLAIHSNIQNLVFEEIKRVFPNNVYQFSSDSLNQLNYVDMVIKETLRLFPIVPIVSRKVSTELQLENYKIPSGTSIGISIFTLHRREDIWGVDADKFNPDNFLPENISKRHQYSYIPFAGGIRNCVGSKYAIMSMKIILINLIRNYEFKTDLKYEDLRVSFDITLKLVNTFLVSVKKRL